jgi:hypothetical protein
VYYKRKFFVLFSLCVTTYLITPHCFPNTLRFYCQPAPDIRFCHCCGHGTAAKTLGSWVAGKDADEGIVAKGQQLIADATAFPELSITLGHDE